MFDLETYLDERQRGLMWLRKVAIEEGDETLKATCEAKLDLLVEIGAILTAPKSNELPHG